MASVLVFLLFLVKVSVLLGVMLAAAPLLRRSAASTRHRLWSGVFVAVVALPLLTMVLPSIDVPVPALFASPVPVVSSLPLTTTPVPAPEIASSEAVKNEEQAGLRTPTASAPPSSPTPAASSRFSSVSLSTILLSVWMMGTLAGLAAVTVSLVRVSRMARRASAIDDPSWREAIASMSRRLGLAREPRVLRHGAVASPMAGGVWRPTVFVPESSAGWTAECRDVVLAHEMVHLVQRDPLRHVITRLAVALYWFHPLAWMAARRSAMAREQACDESVLALGTKPSSYARVLLELADTAAPSASMIAALPMAQRSHLEERVMTILNDHVRPAAARKLRVPAVAVAVLTLAVAAARPAASVPDSIVNPRAETRLIAATETPSPSTTPAVGAPTFVAADLQVRGQAGPKGPARQVSALQMSAQSSASIPRDSACSWEATDSRYFSGSISSADRGGRNETYRQVGRRGGDRVIQWTFGDLRVCMLAEGAGDNDDTPSRLVGSARRVMLETRTSSRVQQLEVTSDGRSVWRVDGRDRAVDGSAREWRDRMLATLDATWELSNLRGRVSSLRGEISSVRGEESSLRGQISSLRGHISSLRGQISSVQGHESSLRGQISSIRGHESSLRGEISSERGAISSLNARRYGSDSADRSGIDARIREHEDAIRRVEREIRDYDADARVTKVEKQIAAFDTDGQVRAIEKDIAAFDVEAKVAAVTDRIRTLDVGGKVASFERDIRALDADRRGADLESRLDAAAKRLADTVAAIR